MWNVIRGVEILLGWSLALTVSPRKPEFYAVIWSGPCRVQPRAAASVSAEVGLHKIILPPRRSHAYQRTMLVCCTTHYHLCSSPCRHGFTVENSSHRFFPVFSFFSRPQILPVRTTNSKHTRGYWTCCTTGEHPDRLAGVYTLR